MTTEEKNEALEIAQADLVKAAFNSMLVAELSTYLRLLSETVAVTIDLVKKTAEGCKTLEEFVHQIDLIESRRAKRAWEAWTQGTEKKENEQ